MLRQIQKWCVQALQVGLRTLQSIEKHEGSLKEGYTFKNHIVVDENCIVESTGDIIEKLKRGFITFKEEDFK